MVAYSNLLSENKEKVGDSEILGRDAACCSGKSESGSEGCETVACGNLLSENKERVDDSETLSQDAACCSGTFLGLESAPRPEKGFISFANSSGSARKIWEDILLGKSVNESLIERAVCCYDGNSEVFQVMSELIKEVFYKFTGCNICEDEYKKDDFSLSSLERIADTPCPTNPSREDFVDAVLRVSVNVVIQLEMSCCFLSRSFGIVERYLRSSLGVDTLELALMVANAESACEFKSYEELRYSIKYIVLDLLKNVATGCLYLANSCYYGDLRSRSSLSPQYVGTFLRKIVALLILFPEGLHAKFVSGELICECCFDKLFSEGKCNQVESVCKWAWMDNL